MPLRHKIFIWNNNSYLFPLPACSMNFHRSHWTSRQWSIHYWTLQYQSHNMCVINAHWPGCRGGGRQREIGNIPRIFPSLHMITFANKAYWQLSTNELIFSTYIWTTDILRNLHLEVDLRDFIGNCFECPFFTAPYWHSDAHYWDFFANTFLSIYVQDQARAS